MSKRSRRNWTPLAVTYTRPPRDPHTVEVDEPTIQDYHPDDGINYGKFKQFKKQDVPPAFAFHDVIDIDFVPMYNTENLTWDTLETLEDICQGDASDNPLIPVWIVVKKAVPQYKEGKGNHY